MKGELLFLGTGGSMGIPVIGCSCPVCRSSSLKNKRLRPSALLQINGRNILIDAGPDLRTQALKYGINQLDGVILTHCHYDHTAGVDDLRVFNMWQQKAIPVLASDETFDELKARFGYIFQTYDYKLTSKIEQHRMKGERGGVDFQGLFIHYTSYFQGGMKVNGLKIGNLAFVTDIKDFKEFVFEDLSGIKTLVISALRSETSPLHLSIDEAIAFGVQLGAETVFLTHIGHEVDHEEASKKLPPNVFFAYDGLQVSFEV